MSDASRKVSVSTVSPPLASTASHKAISRLACWRASLISRPRDRAPRWRRRASGPEAAEGAPVAVRPAAWGPAVEAEPQVGVRPLRAWARAVAGVPQEALLPRTAQRQPALRRHR